MCSSQVISLGQNATKERNWIHLLINIIRQGIRQGLVTQDNKIQIITFNYDMILEYVLDNQFANTEFLTGKMWQDYIEILHPHGKCDSFPSLAPNTANAIVKWAQGIFVIQENPMGLADEVFLARERAQEWVVSATEIYAAGFSFAGPNCRLLGMETKAFKAAKVYKKIDFCNYDGNLGLSRTVSKLKVSANSIHPRVEVEEQSGKQGSPLSVVNWIRMGVIGELPG